MKCLECQAQLAQLDNAHLAACCGLTLQEYAIRHNLPLEMVVPRSLLGEKTSPQNYPPSALLIPRNAKIALAAVHAAGLLERRGEFCMIVGEVRRLDQLLWLAQQLRDYGFCFRQSYSFDPQAHRLTASNQIRALQDNVPAPPLPEELALTAPEFLFFMAVLVMLRSDLYGGCVFLPLPDQNLAHALTQRLFDEFNVEMKSLTPVAGGVYLRTLSSADADTLLSVLRSRMLCIPDVCERFYGDFPQAIVAKELVFDSAHFITDHPGKCSNLHGGRYHLIVKVKDRIDPYTGFVVDYAYVKAVVRREVIDKLDHQHLNLSEVSLGWRSSTEIINLFIWRQLIEYLPNLYELQTYETAQSYCCFRGPTLDEMRGLKTLSDAHFTSEALGRSELRRLLSPKHPPPHLTIVGED